MNLIEKIDSILEVFNTPIKIIKKKMSQKGGEVFFNVKGVDYVFEYLELGMKMIEPYRGYDVSFSMIRPGPGSIEDRGRFTDIMNVGDPFHVFSGVIHSMKMFISLVNPDIIQFLASEKSRQRLYDRFYKLAPKEIGYNQMGKTKAKGAIVYWFSRKDLDFSGPDGDKIRKFFRIK